jgi:hypothetical protein
VLPYLFIYDLTWAVLAVAWLAVLGLRTGFRAGEREVLFAAWLVPVAALAIFAVSARQLGFAGTLLVLLVALRRATRPGALPTVAAQAAGG